MSRGKTIISFGFWGAALLILILDSKTAANGALEGIELCLYTVIPVLFPFFLVSGMINHRLSNRQIPILSPLGKLCKIPTGTESILLLGLTGGYPVGAKCIYESEQNGNIPPHVARRMFGFCNNAGPSYIFGFMVTLFSTPMAAFTIWIIHILSAIITAAILPVGEPCHAAIPVHKKKQNYDCLASASHAIIRVCEWVIIFKLLIAFLERWLFWYIPAETKVLILGLLELTNGTICLNTIASEGMRFVYTSFMLAAGGICVAMQVSTFGKKEHMQQYIIGKTLQSCIAFLLAYTLQWRIFDKSECCRLSFIPVVIISIIISVSVYLNRKILVEIWKRILYNRLDKRKEVLHAIPKKD
jgi:hypothetical protein